MPIEARGRKDPALAASLRGEPPQALAASVYVVGRRPLKVGDELRRPGDPIPEAASWPRLESWLHTGAVKLVPPDAVESTPAPRKRVSQREPEPVREEQATKPVLRPIRRSSE